MSKKDFLFPKSLDKNAKVMIGFDSSGEPDQHAISVIGIINGTPTVLAVSTHKDLETFKKELATLQNVFKVEPLNFTPTNNG